MILKNNFNIKMNNAEFRSQIAREMIALRREKNLWLDKINNLVWVADSVIESARNHILETFHNRIEELRERPWFKEAEEQHKREIQAHICKKNFLKRICVSHRMFFE